MTKRQPRLLALMMIFGCGPKHTNGARVATLDAGVVLTPDAASAPADAAPKGPPVARTVDVVDDVAGERVADPYRWMEGEGNAETTAFLTAQGEWAAQQFAALPSRDALAKRLEA